MGRGKFARTRGVLLNQTSKLAVVIGALSILGASLGASAEFAHAAEAGGSSAPPAQADAVNESLLKKMEAREKRIKSLEAQVKQQEDGKPAAASDTASSTKPSDQSKAGKSNTDKSQ